MNGLHCTWKNKMTIDHAKEHLTLSSESSELTSKAQNINSYKDDFLNKSQSSTTWCIHIQYTLMMLYPLFLYNNDKYVQQLESINQLNTNCLHENQNIKNSRLIFRHKKKNKKQKCNVTQYVLPPNHMNKIMAFFKR